MALRNGTPRFCSWGELWKSVRLNIAGFAKNINHRRNQKSEITGGVAFYYQLINDY
ncbi:MAG: hypothetical protein V7K94_31620 [Nostoc sp.]|uniref:hypothetical protein n=1 Tax=Nostoc sp. TaxID=1180 RepID=UPI002FFABB1A